MDYDRNSDKDLTCKNLKNDLQSSRKIMGFVLAILQEKSYNVSE